MKPPSNKQLARALIAATVRCLRAIIIVALKQVVNYLCERITELEEQQHENSSFDSSC